MIPRFPDVSRQPHVREFRKLALKLWRIEDSIVTPAKEDFSLRDINVSPYTGAYGLAGYVLAVNGSPPRGTFIAVASYRHVFYLDGHGRSRRLSYEHGEIVWEYLEAEGYRVR